LYEAYDVVICTEATGEKGVIIGTPTVIASRPRFKRRFSYERNKVEQIRYSLKAINW